MKLRSIVRTSLLTKVLFRGAFFAFFGSFLLLFSVFIPLDLLNSYGSLIFLCAFLFIGWGLYPYQKLKMLQMQPHEIIFLDNEAFIFSWKRKAAFKIAVKDIKEVFYKDSFSIFGICLNLKKAALEKTEIINPHFNLSLFSKKCQKTENCDLFLPYFSKNAFLEVVDRINQSPD
ncbi:MAG TPA: hypothetical protein PLC42_05505 [Parachlamydiaceae bacterium]|nr:hypothetical protein [Parachlamydiaceae bacterium]